MEFFIKLKDMKPGDVSSQYNLTDGGFKAAEVIEALRKLVLIPEETWLLSVRLEITAQCIEELEAGDDEPAD